MVVFPFFYETCTQMGRLFALQSKISRRDIHTRMAEKYSNQGTEPRSVNRVIQSLIDWGLLDGRSPNEFYSKTYKPLNILLRKWLLEVVIYSAIQRRISVQGLYKLPVLFPFEYNGDMEYIISTSSKIRAERSGDNFVYLVWNG